ncbi:MAG: tetratricopeptide repeat protein, partial [Deltaproteobacteria bacterium]|nr:tetratricopeptide repeat protein [Deltaproteobacteria bacterium]
PRYEKDHAEAQLGVARMAIDTGKYETAEKFIKKLMAADPPPSPRQLAMAYLASAIVLDEQGKSAEADKEQARAFDTDSRNAELYILKARRLTRAGKSEDAIASIREAIKRDPKRANFYAELAKALLARPGGAKEAVESLNKAIASMGESPKLLVLRGNAQRADKDLDGARATFEKAMGLAKGKLPEALLALAEIARDRKEYPKALELFEKAKNESLSSAKNQAYALTEMGKIVEEQGDKKGALDRFKAAAGADASFAPPLYLMAKLFVTSKDKEQRSTAYQLLEKYLELDPKGEYAEDAKRLLEERKK